jgi:hypothetical protein
LVDARISGFIGSAICVFGSRFSPTSFLPIGYVSFPIPAHPATSDCCAPPSPSILPSSIAPTEFTPPAFSFIRAIPSLFIFSIFKAV